MKYLLRSSALFSLLFLTFILLEIQSFGQSAVLAIPPDKAIDSLQLLNWLKENKQIHENIELKLTKSFTDELGITHHKYVQSFDGIEIFGSEIIAHTKRNAIQSVNGTFIKGNATLPKASFAVLSEREIIEIAKSIVKAKEYRWEKDSTHFPKAKLLYIKERVHSPTQNYVLAYKVNIYAVQPLYHANLYLDASSGKLILEDKIIKHIDATTTVSTAYSGSQQITTYQSGGGSNYQLKCPNIGGGISTYDCHNSTSYSSASIPQNANNTWIYSNVTDRAILDAHWGAIKTYTYYMSKHNQNSFDNLGSEIKSYVHYDQSFSNAFWDGEVMTYGDGDGSFYSALTCIDIIGHELSHGVTEFSAGLMYSGESGALNESFSDIFGNSIEYYAKPNGFDWKIGNEISLNGSFIRDMSDPNSTENPDTYLGLYWDYDEEVHTNSGVQNYWFYLLTKGGSGVNDKGNTYNVSGIGIEKAAKIAYRNLTVYLTSSSNYQDARTYSILAAKDLYGDCSDELAAVTNAWYAVGVGTTFSTKVVADFSSTTTYHCAVPAQITFKNNSSNGLTYNWNFGDGSSNTSKNPIHIYDSAGIYNVTLIASGVAACGNNDTLTKNAYITITNSNSFVTASCSPEPYLLNPTYGIKSFVFNTISNTSSASDAGYEDFTCSVLTTVTEGESVNFSISEFSTLKTNIKIWIDINNNGIFSNGELVYNGENKEYHAGKIIIPKGLVYDTTLRMRVISEKGATITSSCYRSINGQTEDYSVVIKKAVQQAPIANFQANKIYITKGSEVLFADLSTNMPTSWEWTFSGGSPSTSSTKNPVITFNNLGTYTVTLKVTNDLGSNTKEEIAYIEVVGFDLMCLAAGSSNSTGKLYDSGGGKNKYDDTENCSFTISPGCPSSIVINISDLDIEDGYDYLKIYDGINKQSNLIYTGTGNVVSATCTAVSGNAYITFVSDQYSTGEGFVISWSATNPSVNGNILLTPGAKYPGSNIDFSYSSTANNYLWDFGDGTPSSITANPKHIYAEEGSYQATLTITENNCIKTLSKTVIIDTKISVETLLANKDVKLWPNPTTGIISIDLAPLTGSTKVEIHSIYGQFILSDIITEQNATFNIENTADGIYFLSLINNGYTQTIPVVIQH